MATLKPTTPLLAPNTGPLKPASPLRPKTAPKTPISHPQRRWRFHTHTDTSEQRRRRFQTTAPPRLQHPHAAPMVGGGGASPRHPWAISVTNVVKLEQFEPPCECSCYKRRQSASKNLDDPKNRGIYDNGDHQFLMQGVHAGPTRCTRQTAVEAAHRRTRNPKVTDYTALACFIWTCFAYVVAKKIHRKKPLMIFSPVVTVSVSTHKWRCTPNTAALSPNWPAATISAVWCR